ncbi:MAG TPA: hypothetical protein PLO61_10410 [Fimbriimonadaceae bacterium]|nr:hypothetical protein [Fimbriimonadaceae bacterium]HRJ34012.1 hypothetical protein [Fimbriimonadaceae bacterium]
MNTIVAAQLKGFYVRAWGLPADEPAAVAHEKGVLDATLAAQKQGIQPGMTLPEARAIVPDLRIVSFSESPVAALRESWLDCLVEVGQAVEPGMPHEAWVDLGPHPDPEPVLRFLSERIERDFGSVRLGYGESKWLAEARCHLCPYPNPPLALADIPTLDFRGISESFREQFVFLGFDHVGEIAGAPLSLLKKHFGREADRILQLAQGKGHDPVRPAYPLASRAVERRTPDGVKDRLVLDAILHRLCKNLIRRLCHEELQGSEVRLVIEFEDGLIQTYTRKAPRPLNTVSLLQVAIQQLLSAKVLDQAVVRVRMLMPHLSRLVRPQSGFLSTLNLHQKAAALEPKILEIGSKFGEGKVCRASQLEVPRRIQVLRVWRETTGWK